MTRYELHVRNWGSCTRCELSEKRQRVVLSRGSVPCDVLFIGEAPGRSEDSLGYPFCGPAGYLLDDIIREASDPWATQDERGIVSTPFRMAFTNLVACIPLDEDGNKTKEPDDKYIRACMPRLVEFARMCKPQLVVLVGALASTYVPGQDTLGCDWLSHDVFLEFLNLKHPAAILRMNKAQQGLEIQRCTVRLSNALEALLDAKNKIPF